MTTSRADFDYHVARMLILLDVFTKRGKPFKGLTKLAKLDFLLRYPVFLDRLMKADELEWPTGAEPSQIERDAVESRMIRYKYGPWDNLYYPIIGSLLGRGLVRQIEGSDVLALEVTKEGREAAGRLMGTSAWTTTAIRCQLLKEHYNQSGNALKDRIYRELPDAVERPYKGVI